MAFAKILSGGVLVSENQFDGAKPLVKTPFEYRDGFRAVSSYVDDGENIVETWEYIELTDEEKAEIENHEREVTAEEIAQAIAEVFNDTE